jgi:glucan-binding YG repeat protein
MLVLYISNGIKIHYLYLHYQIKGVIYFVLKKMWFKCFIVFTLFILASTFSAIQSKANSSGTVFYEGKPCENCESLIYPSNGMVYQVVTEINSEEETSSTTVNAINQTGAPSWTVGVPEHFSFFGEPTPMTDSQGNFIFTLYNNNWDDEEDGYYLASINSKGYWNWTFKFDDRYGPSAPLVDSDGTIYVGTGNLSGRIGPYEESYFYAISPEGKLKWKVKMNGDAGNSKLSFDENHNITFRTAGMDDIWANTISTSGKVISSELTEDYFNWTDGENNQYIVDYDQDRLIVKDPSGKILWTYEAELGDYEYLNIIKVTEDGTAYINEEGKLLSMKGGIVNWSLDDEGYSNLDIHPTGLYLVNAEWTDWETDEGTTTVKKVNPVDGSVLETKTVNEPLFGGYFIDSQGKFFYGKGSNILTLNFDGMTTQQGWVKVDGKWYFYDANGMKATSWMKYNGEWYFLNDSGVMQTGWVKDAGEWYYLNTDGAMQTGWLKDGSKWYLLTMSGEMATGWMKDKGQWYYLNSDGAMQTGWLKDGGKWYFLNHNGTMKTGWLSQGGTWYYLNTGGSMQVGWKEVSNEWYYFYSSGKMAANTTIGGYKLGKDGAWIH